MLHYSMYKVTKAQIKVIENIQNDKLFLGLDDDDLERITYFMKQREKKRFM
jgi:hypothetical protein